MRIDAAGRKLIYEFEGVVLHAYLDVVGVPTIGAGMTYYPGTGEKVKLGQTITQAQCDSMFTAIVASFENAVTKAVKVPLNQSQFNALVSICYNIGIGNATKGFLGSTLLKRVNANASPELIKAAFLMWNMGGGKEIPDLIERRTIEADTYIKSIPNAKAIH